MGHIFQEDRAPFRMVPEKCGLAVTSLASMLERMENAGLIIRRQDPAAKRKT